jgi:predicted protein tyrosine phosphatase
MKILFICSQGENRSKYLAEYLQSKGYSTDCGGVEPDGVNPLTQKKVDWADIIIAVREHIKEEFLERFDSKGKTIFNLEVLGDPKSFPKDAQALAKKSLPDFQEKYIYSELRKQLNKHVHKFSK